ncbi:ABC transporter ATP-binding protein [Bacillus sp. CGMCC 1.16541]|uniref:staphylopine uptake ABC transporter ATP-binding protein CntD n=1 Tax=Bacillus sp. CGMCC 1.16541 TaxID=2185143 RepID=UPI000D730396|nr:ABC transporter ATP-binding protein [Bacillus sp. CGMCC 1.16541]
MNVIEVNELSVWDEKTGQTLVHHSSFQVKAGSCLAIVGESGSGKSVTCRAIMKLNPSSLRQSGDIYFKGENLSSLPEKEMRKKRGRQMGMIVQNGMSAFNPSCVVGVHLHETLSEHVHWSKQERNEALCEAMERVMLKDPMTIMNTYPHQLSGGMLQRIMIALALVLKPDLVIADEPTTALDTVSQFEVVEQFRELREQVGCAILFVSHDLGVVKKIADDVVVMKDGHIVEQGPTQAVFSNPTHDYTNYLVSTRLALSNHFNKVMGRA